MASTNKTDIYTDLARMSAMLLAALFALMAFLLVVGVQNPKNSIETLLYVVMGSLGLNLVLFVAGNLLAERSQRLFELSREKGAKETLKPKVSKFSNLFSKFRVVQQLVFVVSIVAVVWLAVALTHFLFKPAPPAPQPSGASSQQQAPAESAEDHAKESAPQPTQ